MAEKAQGKTGRAAAEAERAKGGQRLALLGFAAAFVAMFVVAGLALGLGEPSPEGDEVAVVDEAPEEKITTEELDRALVQTAARQGLREPPAEDDPQFEVIRDAAVSDLILSRWVRGEAEEQGIEISEREIDEELESVKQQQFGSEKAFQRFLDQSGFTLDEARGRIELQLISDRVQAEVLPEASGTGEQAQVQLASSLGITGEEIETFYEENQTQFEQPESRDVRVILTESQADADKALDQLEADDSPSSFKTVAKELSIDEATKQTGGLRQSVIEGQSEAALDEQIFTAPEGELVGPFEGDAGFYVIQVQKISSARTTSLDDATPQIRQTLIAARQQELAQAFQDDFTAKWTSRTFCADGYRIDRCSNAEPLPDPCTEEIATTPPADGGGCDAPVPSTRPIAPGTAGVFGAPAPLGLPQGPVTPVPPGPPGAPPGLIPGAPPGAVPPGATPPGAAPPGAAPPGAAAPPAPPGG